MIFLGVLPLGGWAAASFFKIGPLANGGALKWASLGLAVILAAGLVWAGSLKFALKPVKTTVVFAYTGGVQWWTVPEGVDWALFKVTGAQGGGGCPTSSGGDPGLTFTGIPVTPGQVLQIRVGGKGHYGVCGQGSPPTHAPGGFNGGGAGGAGITYGNSTYYSGGGGGGASDVRHAPYGLAARDIVGGGGGGGGGWEGDGGGGGGWGSEAGGFSEGQKGPDANGQGGYGGTQTAGGAGGPNGGGGLDGEAGTFGDGGAGADHGNGQTAGGGGGGGWNGGGGGGSKIYDYGGGGGGGSNHGPEGAALAPGDSTAINGSVVIEYWLYVSIFS